MPDEFVDCIITSPPYWGLRDYGIEGQIGLEPTLEEYLEKMLAVTAELKRVLKPTGVCFWNHGDSYGGSASQGYGGRSNDDFYGGLHAHGKKRPIKREKCLNLQNYRLILRMIDEQGWILRNILIWHKPNHMPSSVKDRFTNAYEPVFMLVKNKEYWFDLDAVRVPHSRDWWNEQWAKRYGAKGDKSTVEHLKDNNPAKLHGGQRAIGECYSPLGKNPGDVWSIPTQPFPEAHFATFPERLVEPMIKAGCPQWICKKCGKARERMVEREVGYQASSAPDPNYQRIRPGGNSRPISEFMKQALSTKRYTIGWTDCGCNAGWRPGIVFDPFMGSGTVAKVATRLRRQWIGIELNPEYVEMAYRRLDGTQLEMFA